jgi:Skp family chaperone for outer membrane proteins
MHGRQSIIAFVFTCTAVLVCDAAQTPPPVADHVPQIAVVRTAYVTHNSIEWKQMSQGIQVRLKEIRDEQARKTAEIDKLTEQQSQLKQGSAQWIDLRDQIDDKKLGLEMWAKKMDLELQRREKSGIKTIYDHVSQAVQKIAEDRHYDLVLADNSPEFTGPDLDRLTSVQLQQALAMRAVLFTTKKADITEEVLTLLDSNFANKQNPAASVPQAPATLPGH